MYNIASLMSYINSNTTNVAALCPSINIHAIIPSLNNVGKELSEAVKISMIAHMKGLTKRLSK
jgi:hypothetical protein